MTYKILMITFLSLRCLATEAQQREFGWLVGKWKLAEQNAFEEWRVSSDNKTLQGISYQVKENDTVVTERLMIKFEQPYFFYTSDVAENPEPVKFRITQYNSDKFLAENPMHDFPKAIRYKLIRKDDQDFINATIEGDGKVIAYAFSRVK